MTSVPEHPQLDDLFPSEYSAEERAAAFRYLDALALRRAAWKRVADRLIGNLAARLAAQDAEPEPPAPKPKRQRRPSPSRLAKWEAAWQAEQSAESES